MLIFKNEKTKSLIIESLLIVFSVMLGLFVNDIRTSINKKETASIAWKNIQNEISFDEEELNNSLARQKKLRQVLIALVTSKDKSVFKGKTFYRVIHSAGGINFPTLSTAAWETAKNRGIIEDFDYSKLLILTNIEQEVKAVENVHNKIIDLIYNKDDFKVKYTKDLSYTLLMALTDLMETEKQLLNNYKKV